MTNDKFPLGVILHYNLASQVAISAFWDQVRVASRASDVASFRDGYAQAIKLAGPALQEYIQTRMPEVRKAHFAVNYTDEGSALVVQDLFNETGQQVDANMSDILEVIDEMIFVVTGAGEDGSNIPGLKEVGTDLYELHVPAPEAVDTEGDVDPGMKYCFTGILHPRWPELQRIRALRDIPRYGVKAGDLGGYIESEENLADDGDCWVDSSSAVGSTARVSGNVLVAEGANVTGNVRLEGNTRLLGGQAS